MARRRDREKELNKGVTRRGFLGSAGAGAVAAAIAAQRHDIIIPNGAVADV